MPRRTSPQLELFEAVEDRDHVLPEDTQTELIALLAQWMRSVVQTRATEVDHEQDQR
jgi:hypothetical protein